MCQELFGQLSKLLEVGKILARQLIAKLNSERVQFQQSPERRDILVLIFEQPKQRIQVVGSRVVNSLKSQPSLQSFLDRLLEMETRCVWLGVCGVSENQRGLVVPFRQRKQVTRCVSRTHTGPSPLAVLWRSHETATLSTGQPRPMNKPGCPSEYGNVKGTAKCEPPPAGDFDSGRTAHAQPQGNPHQSVHSPRHEPRSQTGESAADRPRGQSLEPSYQSLHRKH